jgi:anaerobic dimethyl sulfoxide reductase subunit B (iron-sulfur subunit)
MKRQLTFALDFSRCSGCYACVVACQDQNDPLTTEYSFRRVNRMEKGPFPIPSIFISIACFHCGDAPCLMVCPTGAIFRHEDTSIVDIQRDLCIGCHSCELACPFGAPRFVSDGRMAKCDLCAVRVDQGMEPACVHTCPTRALTFGDATELAQAKAEHAGLCILKAVTPEPKPEMIKIEIDER